MGLGAIPVIYRMCSRCQFIFTDFFDSFSRDQWQRYVYNDEYIKVDPEYIDVRPRRNARVLTALLSGRKARIIGLDYGGGNGKTVALLRENGWCFDTYDPFGHKDVSPKRNGYYNFCSASEVFEHSADPVASLRDIVERASPDRLMILIGSSVHDGIVSKETRLSWWYAAPRNGHISLFSRKSMQTLAAQFGLRYSTVRAKSGSHFMTRGIGASEARAFLLRGKVLFKLRTALKMWNGNLA